MKSSKGYSFHLAFGRDYGEHDARRLSNLANRLGYEPPMFKTGTDATKKAFFNGIDYFRKKMTADDILLLTFSGHGDVESTNGRTRQMWLLAPEPGTYPSQPVYDDEIRNALLSLPANSRIFVVADACFSGDSVDTYSALHKSRTSAFNKFNTDNFLKYLGNVLIPLDQSLMPDSGEEPGHPQPVRMLLAATGADSTPTKQGITFDDADAMSGLLPEAIRHVMDSLDIESPIWPSARALKAACVNRLRRYFRPNPASSLHYFGGDYLPPTLWVYPKSASSALDAPVLLI